MGNIPLSSEDISFLKEKGSNKCSTKEIREAFKEFCVDLDTKGKKMHEVTINFDQFSDKCDSIFNQDASSLNPPNDKKTAYQHLFRAFDKDKVHSVV